MLVRLLFAILWCRVLVGVLSTQLSTDISSEDQQGTLEGTLEEEVDLLGRWTLGTVSDWSRWLLVSHRTDLSHERYSGQLRQQLLGTPPATLRQHALPPWRVHLLDRRSDHPLRKANNNILGQRGGQLCAQTGQSHCSSAMPTDRGLLWAVGNKGISKKLGCQNVPALKRRIAKCISEIPHLTVLATMETVRKRLRRAYRVGLLEACH